MKIKRIILTALCLIMAIFALVSCEEDILEEAKEPLDEINNIYKPVELEKVTLDLYIIADEATTDNAITTVSKSIQEYLDDRTNKKFDTTLNIKFIRGDVDTYKSEIASANSGIVLVVGSDMVNDMITNDRLADLNGYFTDAELKEKYQFATLNRDINKNLLDAAITKVEEEIEKDGTTETVVRELRCFIPNDHVIGSYDYILINKEIANALYFYNELLTMDNYDKTQALRDEFERRKAEDPEFIFKDKTVDDLVKQINDAPYEYRFSAEVVGSDVDKGFVCNVVDTPSTTFDEAAEAGFGVLSGTENVSAAMEIIYLLNTDATLRNLLQYGNVSVNYRMEDGVVVPYATGENVYKMDLRYTGNMFLGYYCEAEGWELWTEEIVNNGRIQNSESKLAAN